MLGGKLMFGHQDDQPTVSDQSDDSTFKQPAANGWQGSKTAVAAPPASDFMQSSPAPIPPAATLPTVSLPATAAGDDDLLSIKQQALSALSPIVSHLDQTPEEKFRTTMMMIQASDNQTLIKNAYEAATAIIDEKQKAQALLDIVNEINYFTHQGQNG